jgi:hypothetical protein
LSHTERILWGWPPIGEDDDTENMSGRGAKIVVRRIDTGEELFLSCALHAPLYILKQQLQTITQVPTIILRTLPRVSVTRRRQP